MRGVGEKSQRDYGIHIVHVSVVKPNFHSTKLYLLHVLLIMVILLDLFRRCFLFIVPNLNQLFFRASRFLGISLHSFLNIKLEVWFNFNWKYFWKHKSDRLKSISLLI